MSRGNKSLWWLIQELFHLFFTQICELFPNIFMYKTFENCFHVITSYYPCLAQFTADQ